MLVQLKKDSNKRSRFSAFKDKYPLSGIVYCSCCKRPMNRNYYNYRKSNERIVLTCKNNYRNKEDCKQKPIDNHTLELATASALKELNLYDELIIDNVLSIVKKSFDNQEVIDKIDNLTLDIQKIEDEIVALINNKINSRWVFTYSISVNESTNVIIYISIH